MCAGTPFTHDVQHGWGQVERDWRRDHHARLDSGAVGQKDAGKPVGAGDAALHGFDHFVAAEFVLAEAEILQAPCDEYECPARVELFAAGDSCRR